MKSLSFLTITTMIFLGFTSQHSAACVWVPEDGPTVYWHSARIQVCFVEQNLPTLTTNTGKTFSSELSRTHEVVTQAIQEMSTKTRFDFYGFTKCDPNDSSPMIRINFSRAGGEGKTESIGPNSARTRPFNLTLSQIPVQETEQRVDQTTGASSSFDNVAWAKTASQHEVMHLLGFHHDMPRVNDAKGGGWDRFMRLQGATRRVDPEFDSESVMNVTGHGKELSGRDITCINELAERTIRYNSVQTNPLTTETPLIHTTPAQSPKPTFDQNSGLTPISPDAAIE